MQGVSAKFILKRPNLQQQSENHLPHRALSSPAVGRGCRPAAVLEGEGTSPLRWGCSMRAWYNSKPLLWASWPTPRP